MILAVDVYYKDAKAKAAGVLFEKWEDEKPAKVFSCAIDKVANYEPGCFYKRELPCIEELLKQIDVKSLCAIVVDGYVYLDDEKRPGLGHYLYEKLSKETPVIGVAKNEFINNKQNTKEVLRGESLNPLFVTAVGYDLDEAAEGVTKMHGEHRMPTLLKLLDNNTKNSNERKL